jgi:hypothetical protein
MASIVEAAEKQKSFASFLQKRRPFFSSFRICCRNLFPAMVSVASTFVTQRILALDRKQFPAEFPARAAIMRRGKRIFQR